MTADSTLLHPGLPQSPTMSVAERSTRRAATSPAERLARQVQGIDAWVAARREREQTLFAPGLSRQQRLDVCYEVEALRRTHEAIKSRCAHLLAAAGGPLGWPVPTAVIAHRHAWFVDKLALHLVERGVSVLVRTENGAEALGAVIAEQPEIVLLGDRLAMMPVEALVADVRRFAPATLLAVAASDPHKAGAWRAQVDAVFLNHHPPGDVADTLDALCPSAA